MRTEKGYIYKIISPNNKIYIGQTKNFEKRKLSYKYLQFKNQIKLWNNCKKYNWNPIDTIEIIDECDVRCKNILDMLEIYWIKEYNSFANKNGLNLTKGGFGSEGIKQSPESIAKRVLSNTGKKRTQETKDKISIGNKGKTRSKETIEKYRKNNLGKILSKETKEKISLSSKFSENSGKWIKGCESQFKGKKFPERTKLKGRIFSEETREKMSIAPKNRKTKSKTKSKTNG